MLKPKHLYTVNDYYWLVFPTKEAATRAACASRATAVAARSAQLADFWSEELGCLVSFIEPNSNFMVLEADGKFVKIIGNKIGWIVANMSVGWVKDSFEEITGV